MMQRTVVLDTETTGLSPKAGHRLTEIGCVEILDRKISARQFQTYLNPERDLDLKAAEITGLSWSFLKDKPLFSAVAKEFLAFIEGAELVIHNASFDLGFLNTELTHIQYPKLPLENHFTVIDTLKLAREKQPGHRYYHLDALCQRYGVSNDHRQLHGALLDAQILAEVYLKMTAGQVSLSFELEAKTKTTKQSTLDRNKSRVMESKLISTGRQYSVLQASEEEQATHLAYMQSLSEGKA